MAEVSDAIWTIKGCLDWTVGYLERKGDEHPRVSAEWLLSAALGVERIDLYMNYDRPLSLDERATIREAVRRRGRGEPLQYVTGETSFRGHTICCEPGVLIPRPETELLTDMVLRYLDERILGPWVPERERVELPWNEAVEAARQAEAEAARTQTETEASEGSAAAAANGRAADAAHASSGDVFSGRVDGMAAAPSLTDDGAASSESTASASEAPAEAPAVPHPDGTLHAQARVLEVGCGTGCISLSLALERRGRVACVATDIDEAPVNLARRNRMRSGLDERAVDIRQGDLVAPVRPEEYGAFDVLVSNPPYIPSSVVDQLGAEVKDFEPRLALDGGTDGLDVYRRLVAAAPHMLRPGGLFACELYEDAVHQAAALCSDAGMVNVRVIEDLARHPRFVFAEMPAAI